MAGDLPTEKSDNWTLDGFIEAFKTWSDDELPARHSGFPYAWVPSIEHVKKLENVLTHCMNCKFPCFYYPHTNSLMPGHCYTKLGVAEVKISGLCEWCFDQITKEPDDSEHLSLLGESEEAQIIRIERIVEQEVEAMNKSFDELLKE